MLWRVGRAEVRARVIARGAVRVGSRRLHAIQDLTVVGCEFDAKGSAAAGRSALRAGEHSGAISPTYCRLSEQGAAGNDPGRFRRALSLLRPAGRQGGPLRRSGGGGSDGLVWRRYGWPDG